MMLEAELPRKGLLNHDRNICGSPVVREQEASCSRNVRSAALPRAVRTALIE
ncbi:MAG TPA: hypothetical protein VGS41_10365 [Chthonomonadales bacterium]|nr:hypothetical protein [Chthonomonadales bacterium]